MTDAPKPRSSPQHRRFFGLVKAAYAQWPESHDFQPENEEHLRAYLLVAVRHSVIKDFHLDHADEMARVLPIVAAMMLHRYCWCKAINAGTVRVWVPDSIAYDKCTHAKACDVFNAVDELVETVIGVSADQLLENAMQALVLEVREA